MATNRAPVERFSTRILVVGWAGLPLLGVVGAALAMMGAALAAQTVVPVRTVRMPDTPYEYANVPLPAHFQTAGAVDNTPADNPITNDGATLGRVLFYDTALSANGRTSCSSCHKQEHAFADPNRVSRGFDGRFTDRHAMNLTGLRYYPRARFFWDDRGGNLEEMVLLPVQSRVEMGQDLIILADHSKLGRKAAAYIAPLKRIATLLTDLDADPNFIESARELGIQVIQV